MKKMETIMDNEILPTATDRVLFRMEAWRRAKLFVLDEDRSWVDSGSGVVHIVHRVRVLD